MVRRYACILAAAGLLPAAPSADAQVAAGALGLPAPPAAADELLLDAPLHDARRYVIIRLAENRLYVMEGRRAIWSAPVGTGTGFRLERDGRAWEFQTPRGVFRIQRKEKNPVWIKPDWAFIEAGQPVPPVDSPLRRDAAMLGTSALYIGYELALHGTNKPELVLQPDPEHRRVSHGCIRLTNEDARTLYHLVDVGTPVLIH